MSESSTLATQVSAEVKHEFEQMAHARYRTTSLELRRLIDQAIADYHNEGEQVWVYPDSEPQDHADNCLCGLCTE